jgi:23S rRNA pseudouridine2605 synthase
MNAASHVEKVYLVKIAGKPDPGELEKLRRGLSIPAETRFVRTRDHQPHERGPDARSRKRSRPPHRVRTAPAKLRIIREAENPWYEVTLTEGKNRQIRKMFEEIGHHVEKIRRVRYGPLTLDVPPGAFRQLSLAEIQRLKASAGLNRRHS